MDVEILKSILQCTVCLEVKRGGTFYYQCINNHNICEICMWKNNGDLQQQEYPLCPVGLCHYHEPPMRNVEVERLIYEVNFEHVCSNEDCDFKAKDDELDKHIEEECHHRKVDCPDCRCSVKVADLLDHIQSWHESKACSSIMDGICKFKMESKESFVYLMEKKHDGNNNNNRNSKKNKYSNNSSHFAIRALADNNGFFHIWVLLASDQTMKADEYEVVIKASGDRRDTKISKKCKVHYIDSTEEEIVASDETFQLSEKQWKQFCQDNGEIEVKVERKKKQRKTDSTKMPKQTSKRDNSISMNSFMLSHMVFGLIAILFIAQQQIVLKKAMKEKQPLVIMGAAKFHLPTGLEQSGYESKLWTQGGVSGKWKQAIELDDYGTSLVWKREHYEDREAFFGNNLTAISFRVLNLPQIGFSVSERLIFQFSLKSESITDNTTTLFHFKDCSSSTRLWFGIVNGTLTSAIVHKGKVYPNQNSIHLMEHHKVTWPFTTITFELKPSGHYYQSVDSDIIAAGSIMRDFQLEEDVMEEMSEAGREICDVGLKLYDVREMVVLGEVTVINQDERNGLIWLPEVLFPLNFTGEWGNGYHTDDEGDMDKGNASDHN